MSPITERLTGCHLAATEVLGFSLLGLKGHGRELTTLMRTITKRLALTLATGAPEIGCTRLYFNGIWSFLSDGRLHGDSPLCCNFGYALDNSLSHGLLPDHKPSLT